MAHFNPRTDVVSWNPTPRYCQKEQNSKLAPFEGITAQIWSDLCNIEMQQHQDVYMRARRRSTTFTTVKSRHDSPELCTEWLWVLFKHSFSVIYKEILNVDIDANNILNASVDTYIVEAVFSWHCCQVKACNSITSGAVQCESVKSTQSFSYCWCFRVTIRLFYFNKKLFLLYCLRN